MLTEAEAILEAVMPGTSSAILQEETEVRAIAFIPMARMERAISRFILMGTARRIFSDRCSAICSEEKTQERPGKAAPMDPAVRTVVPPAEILEDSEAVSEAAADFKAEWMKRITTFIQIAALVAIFFFGTDIRLLFVFSAIIGLCMCNGAIAPGMMADSIEYGDWKYGVREVGLTFSFVGFSVKLATAVSGVVTVQLLNAIGYVPNVEQTASVKMGINAIVNLFPAAVILVSAIFIFFYDLSPKKMDQIYADLEARRGAEAEKAARAEEQTDAAIEADNEQL